MNPVDVFDASDAAQIDRAVEASRDALVSYGQSIASTAGTPEEDDISPLPVKIPETGELIGIDSAVYRQAEAAINSGKAHIMLYGPPGTGKTTLARYIAERVSTKSYTLVTGSADWTSQDLIGGYQPVGPNKIAFVPGIMLKDFDKPFIIDELNRCDIDKVLGPMFTVLSGHSTTLPYRVTVDDPDSEQYQILGMHVPGSKPPIFSPGSQWRIIATINTVDKASLYQMSYALSRRFAWIFVDVPLNLNEFVQQYVWGSIDPTLSTVNLPLVGIWSSVNASKRPLGAAPFIDMIKQCKELDAAFDFKVPPTGSAVDAYLDAFKAHVMPMLDGLLEADMKQVAEEVADAIGLAHADARFVAFERQMRSIGL